MPKIKVGRYETTGGTEKATPIGKFYAGWIEPEDKRWILFIGVDGTPTFYGRRDPETGACIDPPVTMIGASRELLESSHAVGADVHVVFDGRPDSRGYLKGCVAAVTFNDYGKVLYDVRIDVGDGRGHGTVVKCVDSRFVMPPPPQVEPHGGVTPTPPSE